MCLSHRERAEQPLWFSDENKVESICSVYSILYALSRYMSLATAVNLSILSDSLVSLTTDNKLKFSVVSLGNMGTRELKEKGRSKIIEI